MRFYVIVEYRDDDGLCEDPGRIILMYVLNVPG